jgi:hypothetical protein
MVGKVQKSYGARSGLYGGCSVGVPPTHFFQAEHRIQFTSRPMRFLGLSNHEKGAARQEILPREVLRKRPSSHLHKVPTRSNKVSPRTFQTSIVFYNLNTTIILEKS